MTKDLSFGQASDFRVGRVERAGPLRPAFSQQRLWFADQVGRGQLNFVFPYALRLTGELDTEALRLALDTVIARHEVLRTTFRTVDGELFQVIGDAFSLELPVTPLGAEAELAEKLQRTVEIPFDLEEGPVIRARLYRLRPDQHVLLLVVHHIATDGLSMDILFRELAEVYGATRAGQSPRLPDLVVQFADIAAWERARFDRGEFGDELDFWREHLSGGPQVLTLPLDRARPAVQSFQGDWLSFQVPAAVATRVERLAGLAGASSFQVILAAFQVLLARWSNQSDLIVGTPVANRTVEEAEPLIGFFVNLLPLRGRVEEGKPFSQLLAATRDVAFEAYDHQGLSFDRIVAEVTPERTLAHNPLIQVTLARESNAPARLAGLRVETVEARPPITRYDLAFDYWPAEDGGLSFDAYYAADLFERGTIERLTGRFVDLLEQLTARPDLPLALLTASDRYEDPALAKLGYGPALAGEPASLEQRFLAAAAKTPDAPAVIDEYGSLSFAELERESARITSLLLADGARPELVGLFLPRSVSLVAAILGVLRAGAAYLPLDPDYPQERTSYLLGDSGVQQVLTSAALAGTLRPPAGVTVRTIEESAPVGNEPADPGNAPARPALPQDLAYLIYTSGSTGRPKGVQVTRQAAAELLARLEQAGVVRPEPARVGWNASASFDASVQQWIRVCRGDTVVILSEAVRREPEQLAVLVVEQGLTDLDLTPSHGAVLLPPLTKALAESHGGPLLRLWVGGEPVPDALWEQLGRLRAGGRLDAVNVYGVTEASVDTTWTMIGGPEGPHLGAALPGTEIRILDSWLRPVPAGAIGELCIAGNSLARGYAGKPGTTAARFVPDPAAADGSRLYRTGDRVRRRAQGELEFIGRTDNQVKIRGYRVELGEVEATIEEHSGVLNCVAVCRQTPEGSALEVYLQAERGVSGADVRAFVEDRLPTWMQPSAYALVEEMPRTSSGKLDRAALAGSGPAASHDGALPGDGAAGDEPQGPVEELLAKIWGEVLDLDRVGALDNFFARGGHSLLAIRMVARLKRQVQLSIPMTAVFEYPVLRELAGYVEQTIRQRLAGETR